MPILTVERKITMSLFFKTAAISLQVLTIYFVIIFFCALRGVPTVIIYVEIFLFLGIFLKKENFLFVIIFFKFCFIPGS